MKTHTLLFLIIPLLTFSQKNEIAFKTFTIQGNSCSGFQTPGGSLIFIPSNAFKSDDGGACKGVISIKYREFHSQTDMYYSGLNMIWDDNGRYRLLESVGMFEIQAWCGDKRLALNDNKSIHVRMKCRRDLANLSSFIYNSTKNKWSLYASPVRDFSYRSNNNKADSTDVWASPRVRGYDSVETFVYDKDGNEMLVRVAAGLAARLPEGFFKGMDIRNMGIFNYDGVIGDSLAVPMVPEVVLKSDTNTALNQKLYVYYEGRNSLVYYYPDDFKERFVLLKVKGIRMFTEFQDGSVATQESGEMDKVKIESYRGKKIRIKLTKQPVRPKNKNDLASVTGLKTE